MKKFIFILVGIILLAVVALAAFPFFYKDQIIQDVRTQLDESLDAEVYFDAEKFGVSLFKNFPNLTVSLADFGVVGEEEFSGDTLIAVSAFDVTLNLKSILFDDEFRVKKIKLDNPHLNIKVLEDGRANYDIVATSDSVSTDQQGSDEISFGIDKWVINNGNILYEDQSIPFLMKLENVDHVGGGDFAKDVFDMVTETNIEQASIWYDGTNYVNGKKLDADITMDMNLSESKFTFKENSASLNDFVLEFDGFFALLEEGYDMDINFSTKDNSFKSLLSLVPGMYLKDFDQIKTEGTASFNGNVKGIYNESDMPAFNLDLQVLDGMFQYPDLPTPVKNITTDLTVNVPKNALQDVKIDIAQFHMDMGQNPVDARATIVGTGPMKVNAKVDARLDLADVNRMVPMDGLEMRGDYLIDLNVSGTYDSLKSQFPSTESQMSLANGYVKYDEYPIPMENVTFSANVINKDGKMSDTKIAVEDINMLLDGEKMSGRGSLKNLDDYTWDVDLDGTIDLEKLTKIFPVDATILTGKISADVESKGKMSDIDAGKFNKVSSSGEVTVSGFSVENEELPQKVSISNAQASLSPKSINVSNCSGKMGSSDLKMNGQLSNYMAYIFNENANLTGNLNVSSKRLDLNEWMVEADTAVTNSSEEAVEAIKIPENIAFKLNSDIDEVLYDNLSLKQVNGKVEVLDGVATLNNLNFNTLGGDFTMSGDYDSRDLTHPAFDMGLGVKGLSVQEAYKNITSVRLLAPIAQFINGDFSTDVKLSGELGKDLMPNLATISGSGLMELAKAALTESKFVRGIAAFASMDSKENSISLEDILMNFSIKDGKLNVKPFDLKVAGYESNVSGAVGLDGKIDFKMALDVPAGELGQSANNLIESLRGQEASNSQMVKLNLNIGGTYSDPKFGLDGGGTASTVKSAAEDAIEEEKEKLEEEVKDELKEGLDKLLKGDQADSTVTETEDNGTDELIDGASDLLNGLFKKKKKKKADTTNVGGN